MKKQWVYPGKNVPTEFKKGRFSRIKNRLNSGKGKTVGSRRPTEFKKSRFSRKNNRPKQENEETVGLSGEKEETVGSPGRGKTVVT
ncbi:MAG: hypothetical protein J5872_02280 [Lachnospiraceae bacterium]|nr:hypothetical protein [Lachnospiraceae bacterium]